MIQQAHSRRTDPTTSEDAAESIRPELPELEFRVLHAIQKRGETGATTNELAELMGISLVTVSPRIRPLVRKGFVQDAGKRRKGPSGRKSIVWRATPKPRSQIKEQGKLL